MTAHMIHYYLFHALNRAAVLFCWQSNSLGALLITRRLVHVALPNAWFDYRANPHHNFSFNSISRFGFSKHVWLTIHTENLQTALAFIPPAEAFQPIERAITKNNAGNRKYTLQRGAIKLTFISHHPDGTLGGAAGLKQTRIIYETRRSLWETLLTRPLLKC